ncbi:TPA: hypothetical protein ACUNF5_004493 [Burkholderia orbicola]
MPQQLRKAVAEVCLEERRLTANVMREIRIREELEVAVDEHATATCQARGRRRIEARRPGVDITPKGRSQLGDFVEEILLGKTGGSHALIPLRLLRFLNETRQNSAAAYS